MSTIIRPLTTSKTRSTFVLRAVALRALNSFSADRTSNELSDGPPGFHSLDEEDPCSREIDKLSSDSDSDSSSSDEELDPAGDSASISTTSATALGLGDLCRLSLGSFFGVPPRGIPWSSLRNCFRGGTPAVEIMWLPCRNGSIMEEFTPIAETARSSLRELPAYDIHLILRIRTGTSESNGHDDSLCLLAMSEFTAVS